MSSPSKYIGAWGLVEAYGQLIAVNAFGDQPGPFGLAQALLVGDDRVGDLPGCR
jgi:hypothetical protein